MKKYDLSVTTGKYQVNGQEKRRYENVGEIHENQKGDFYARMKAFTLLGVAMAAIARGDDQIMVNLYAPRNTSDGNGNRAPAPAPQQDDEFADDMPF